MIKNYFLVGVISGSLIMTGWMLFTLSRWEKNNHTELPAVTEMVKRCEANIPRNQVCKLIAIPEVK